jgi:hypothetical protein
MNKNLLLTLLVAFALIGCGSKSVDLGSAEAAAHNPNEAMRQEMIEKLSKMTPDEQQRYIQQNPQAANILAGTGPETPE